MQLHPVQVAASAALATDDRTARSEKRNVQTAQMQACVRYFRRAIGSRTHHTHVPQSTLGSHSLDILLPNARSSQAHNKHTLTLIVCQLIIIRVFFAQHAQV